MSRLPRSVLISAAAILVGGCLSDGPSTIAGPSANGSFTSSGTTLPGSLRTGSMTSGQSTPLYCTPKNAAYGSARIGPQGGTLYVGAHRLTIPAGALDRYVTISGSVPNDRPFEINLQPHGLQFRKAAGLVLDASSCTIVPDIVYLVDQFTVSPPIVATYSNWWHTIACPIWHFSGYAVAFYAEGAVDDSKAGSE
jgi:hypothetical protein